MGSSAGQQGGAAPEEIQIMQIIIERRRKIFLESSLCSHPSAELGQGFLPKVVSKRPKPCFNLPKVCPDRKGPVNVSRIKGKGIFKALCAGLLQLK